MLAHAFFTNSDLSFIAIAEHIAVRVLYEQTIFRRGRLALFPLVIALPTNQPAAICIGKGGVTYGAIGHSAHQSVLLYEIEQIVSGRNKKRALRRMSVSSKIHSALCLSVIAPYARSRLIIDLRPYLVDLVCLLLRGKALPDNSVHVAIL